MESSVHVHKYSMFRYYLRDSELVAMRLLDNEAKIIYEIILTT